MFAIKYFKPKFTQKNPPEGTKLNELDKKKRPGTSQMSERFGPVAGSRTNCRVTTVEGLPGSTGLNSSLQVFQRSLIGVPLSGVASSARQDTIPVSPGISHNMNAGISLETRQLQTQQTGVFRRSTPKARWTNKLEQQS